MTSVPIHLRVPIRYTILSGLQRVDPEQDEAALRQLRSVITRKLEWNVLRDLKNEGLPMQIMFDTRLLTTREQQERDYEFRLYPYCELSAQVRFPVQVTGNALSGGTEVLERVDEVVDHVIEILRKNSSMSQQEGHFQNYTIIASFDLTRMKLLSSPENGPSSQSTSSLAPALAPAAAAAAAVAQPASIEEIAKELQAMCMQVNELNDTLTSCLDVAGVTRTGLAPLPVDETPQTNLDSVWELVKKTRKHLMVMNTAQKRLNRWIRAAQK